MSPRPRTVSDEQILSAAYRAIARLGPTRLTLAEVAGEVGLSPAALVKRFGSKRALLLALAGQGVDSVASCFASIRHAHPSPLAALLVAATEMARHVRNAEELANGLAFLQLDLNDAEFRAIAVESSSRLLEGYRALLDDAVATGELSACDTERLARSVAAIAGGSLIAWAIHRQGSAERWVREDLDTLLLPYRRRTGRDPRPGRQR